MSVILTTFPFGYLVDTKQFSSSIRLTFIKSGMCPLQVKGLRLSVSLSPAPFVYARQNTSPFLFSGGGNANLSEAMPSSFCCFCKVSGSFLFLTHLWPDLMYAPLITSVFLLCFFVWFWAGVGLQHFLAVFQFNFWLDFCLGQQLLT